MYDIHTYEHFTNSKKFLREGALIINSHIALMHSSIDFYYMSGGLVYVYFYDTDTHKAGWLMYNSDYPYHKLPCIALEGWSNPTYVLTDHADGVFTLDYRT